MEENRTLFDCITDALDVHERFFWAARRRTGKIYVETMIQGPIGFELLYWNKENLVESELIYRNPHFLLPNKETNNSYLVLDVCVQHVEDLIDAQGASRLRINASSGDFGTKGLHNILSKHPYDHVMMDDCYELVGYRQGFGTELTVFLSPHIARATQGYQDETYTLFETQDFLRNVAPNLY